MNYKIFLKENRFLIISIIFVIVFLYIFFPSKDKAINSSIKTDQIIVKEALDYQPTLDTLEAKSFYVYDILESKVLFSKDEHLKLPIASITKLMSGLVALDVMPSDTIITISKDDIILDGNSGLVTGEKWKLKDLLDFSLIQSSNGGMHAIAAALDSYETVNHKSTMEIMNEKAKALSLNDTVFINETGLDIDKNMSGAYSSAHDISLLLEKIIKNNPDLISSTNKQTEAFISESKIKHVALNTNVSLNKISGLIASKTGFTDLAGGNLAIIFDAGIMHPIVIVALGSTVDGRFDDIVKLQKIALEKLSE